MRQPKKAVSEPVVSEPAVASENPSVQPLNTTSLLQQITQHQQQLNLFQTLLLNQCSNSGLALPPGTDPLLQVPPMSMAGVNQSGGIPGLGRGMPSMNNNPLGNYLLPGLLPLLENLNLKQDGGNSSTYPGLGRGMPRQNPHPE